MYLCHPDGGIGIGGHCPRDNGIPSDEAPRGFDRTGICLPVAHDARESTNREADSPTACIKVNRGRILDIIVEMSFLKLSDCCERLLFWFVVLCTAGLGSAGKGLVDVTYLKR